MVQGPLTFVADEPGANRKLHRGQSLTMILTTIMMVIVRLFKMLTKMLMTKKKSSSKNLGGYSTLDDKFVICNKLKNNGKSYPKNIRTTK